VSKVRHHLAEADLARTMSRRSILGAYPTGYKTGASRRLGKGEELYVE
jgi:hypothetical protein